jgi:glycosyltransferase involved in cell wall biosynthesis
VSVIVPTHERPASLVRLLRALASVTGRPPHEVIVVADGCSPETASAITAASLPYQVRVIVQEPARGPAMSRNGGAREATGDLLLFIDDDIEPFGDIVDAHRARHDGAPRVVIGAPRTPIARDAGFRELAGWAWWEQQFERLRTPGHRFGYEDVFTGVLSMPRSLWAATGGFDASLQCREDFELGLRLVRQRVAFEFTERGGGWHHENRTGDRLVRRKWAEGAADVALARLHPWAFPALRISRGGADRGGDVFRRMAFDWPRTGRVLAWLADYGEHLLERLRLRGAWRHLHAGAMYFAYWRGAVAALGSWQELDALREAASHALPPGHVELEIDLAEEPEQWHSRVDLVRPDVLRLRYGDLPLGGWGSAPGCEPLRSQHLRALPDEIVSALVIARSLPALRVPVRRVTGAAHG